MTTKNETEATSLDSSFGSRTDVGYVRDHNEDSLVVAPPLFAVADGMGGHEAGEVASEITVNTLAELAPDHLDAEGLTAAVEAANYNVMKAPRQGIGRDGMGTTLTAAMLEGERLLIAQVGDSRAYLLHGGNLQQITRDHSLMADLIEAGQITPEEAKVHPNRSVITRAIGSDIHMRPDIYELNVSAGDRLLLCSDGLSTMVSDHAIQAIMRRQEDPQMCADELVNAALENGGVDNATVIVVDVAGFSAAREEKKARKNRAMYIGLAVALIAILFAAGFGGCSYINNSAYLIEENGTISVYRGVPDEFMGMKLSSLERTTDLEVDKLPPGVANRIKEGMSVASLDEANSLINDYQLEIARTDAEAARAAAANAGNESASTNSNATPGHSADGGDAH
ncbi:Stp1/IreP family PP2C-type Ser/Thr phosphatase [Anaerotardibacter muris]|uniref:Stp1/IreP family PP2C-type Ser/Thr phosphatase n=1 Tax=Anaerotardibacter muris TaxID=2941505 RepID=UPI00203CA599|nr:Stp1/IreP family PP2C-type Ser/Thr phosphatase [Anaerotardibacter muris]